MILFNDTHRDVNVHPATGVHGVGYDKQTIKHGETMEFEVPKGIKPFVKLWDYGEKHGIQILVSAAFGKQEEEA